MGLQELWFVIVGALFLGFFILEGFDFGVGVLMAPMGRPPRETRRGTGAPCSTRSARSGMAMKYG